MVGLLAPTLIAVAIGVALGGSVRTLVTTRVRWWPVILVAFGVELALYNPPLNSQAWALAIGPSVWLATKLALLAVCVRNAWPGSTRVTWPWLLASVGIGLNTLVIALNAGHMPQSHEAAVAVWGASHIDPTRVQNVAPITQDSLLPWLGDVLPQPRWLPRPNVVSAGDIVLAIGIAIWAFLATRPADHVRRRIVGLFWAPLHAPARPTRRCST
jgi:hypothetical protein